MIPKPNNTVRYVVRDAVTREWLGVINANSLEVAEQVAAERFAGRNIRITLSL